MEQLHWRWHTVLSAEWPEVGVYFWIFLGIIVLTANERNAIPLWMKYNEEKLILCGIVSR